MVDNAQFSDDISALWGPSDMGVLEPAPRRGVDEPPIDARPRAATENGNGQADRVGKLERELHWLANRVEDSLFSTVDRADLDTLRTELQADMGEQLAQVRADVLAQLDVRLDDLARQLAAAGAAEPDLAPPAAATGAHELPPAARRRSRRLHHQLQDAFTDELAEVRVGAEEAVERRLAVAEAELTQRLEDLVGRVTDATAQRVAPLERETARLAESMETYRPQLETIAAAEGLLHHRLDDLIGKTRTVVGAVADRLIPLERETARLAEAIEAGAERSVHRLELLELRADLQAAAAERVDAVEREVALLAGSLQAYRAESTSGPQLDALRAELAAAAAAAVAGTERQLSQRLDDLIVDIAVAAAADRVARLKQCLVQLGELLDANGTRSVVGKELDSLRDKLAKEWGSQLTAVRSVVAEPAPVLESNGNGTPPES